MSEPTPDAPAEDNAPQQPQEGSEAKTFTEDYVKELRAEAAKYRTEAKQLKAEVENVRTASLSEAEKAVLEAEQRGRTAVLAEFGQKLARSAFVAEAARRNPGYDAQAVLDDLNLARYVGEDGEPDSKAIAQAVERLVPATTNTTPGMPRPDPSQGPRATASGTTADQFAAAIQNFL